MLCQFPTVIDDVFRLVDNIVLGNRVGNGAINERLVQRSVLKFCRLWTDFIRAFWDTKRLLSERVVF